GTGAVTCGFVVAGADWLRALQTKRAAQGGPLHDDEANRLLLREQMLHAGALFAQFLVGRIHARTREGVDFQTLHDAEFSIFTLNRIAVNHARRDAVTAIRRNTH